MSHYLCTFTCWGLLLKTLLFTVSFQNKSVIIISLMLLAYSGRSSVVFSCHLYSALLSHLTWCYRYDYRGIDNHTGDNWCSAWQLQVLDTSENVALGSPVVSLHSNPWASHHKAITLYSIVKDFFFIEFLNNCFLTFSDIRAFIIQSKHSVLYAE